MPMLEVISEQVIRCKKCPELRDYCDAVGREKRRAYANQAYWAKPVPGFGDPGARVMIVGLAPAAHGANRTGRMFTGDRSGDFLYAALHRAGLASQPSATHRDDGLSLRGVYITAAVRCAPPANKPTPAQRANCMPHLIEEIRIIQPRVLLCLGSIGWNAALEALRDLGADLPKPKPKFAHAGEVHLGATTVLGCYHVSQQNTFTGRLTNAMIDNVLARTLALTSEKA